MRNIIRKLIKESLYDEMERDYTLRRSGKVLPNFRGVITSLTTGPSYINQAISVMEMIEPYSLYSDDIVKSNVQERPSDSKSSEYSVNLYFSDMEVAIAISDFIKFAAESYPWRSFLSPGEVNDKIEILVFPAKKGPNKKYYNIKYYIRVP